MRINFKVNIGGAYIPFEFEGSPNELEGLTENTEKLKSSLKILMEK